MAIDNPSYFSLTGGGTSSAPTAPGPPRGLASLFRRRPDRMGAGSSASVISTSTTSTTLMHHEVNSNRSSASGTSAPSTPTDESVPMLAQSVGTVAPPGGQKRSFRNLFRSVSANSDPERSQQFLKGDPRPSDVAPPSPYLPYRSHSHSENDRCRRPGRRRNLESTGELLSNDMVYCGLPGDDADADPDAEVFLGTDDARYYNVSATLPTPGSAAAGRRRHSIGTFLSKDRSLTRSSPAGRRIEPSALRQPDTVAPPVPTDVRAIVKDGNERTDVKQARRRRHRSSSGKGSRSMATPPSTDMTIEEDVVFVTSKESEASTLWVNYLTACFEQISRQQGKPPFKIYHVAVEETVAPGTEERIDAARLQIVIVCPVLLERILGRVGQTASLARQLHPDKVLAMMLGVHNGHLTDSHRAALISYAHWRKFFVKDQDETFVGDFLGAAVAILGTAPSAALKSDKTAFSVLPKKVKLGQNRVIALLNDPLQPEDNVSVIVDRCGEAIDISHVKKRNPYTLQFSIPERCLEVSMLVGVRILKNGNSLGVRQVKCESRLRELDQILRAHDNPLEFMCQTFGFSNGDREQLDNWMVHAFQRNVPPHFNLLSTPAGMVPAHRSHTSPEENPTLLHFAARFGLEKLAWQLLECPGGDLACDLRNVAELTPADLADQAGHVKLAHQLRGYMQMNEFTNMYSYLKVMSETTAPGTEVPTTDSQQVDYCRPRPLSEAYSVPPAARPLVTHAPQLPPPNSIESDYSIAPTPTPVIFPTINANGLDLPLQGYMEMHPTGPKSSGSTTPSRLGTPTLGVRLESPVERTREENGATMTTSSSAKLNPAKSREPSGPQDELLEIINDFKNNVFTISEVERLVENWRNRNDVRQSFKDKQRQLVAMREEYERIQRRLKDEMKVPTPFDRIRKFFTKGKRETKDSASAENSSSSSKTEGPAGNNRPVSSLSLHSVSSSSSSSGRMSTVSGCSGTSLGDSGTHSDPEDRKLQHPREDKACITSYETPPAPKPFIGRYSPMRYTPPRTIPDGSDTRPLQSCRTPKPEDDRYYIAFPPSGLPIHSFKADGSAKEPKTPSSPSEQPDYLDLAVGDIVDGSNSRNVGSGYANIEPSSSSSSSSSLPLPPQLPSSSPPASASPSPLPPPPGMCIPTEYANVSPSVLQSSCPNSLDRRADNPTRSSNSVCRPDHAADLSNPIQEESTTSGDKSDDNSEEYVQSDAINDALVDVMPDTLSLPEYVNVVPSSQQDAVGKSVKKQSGPPVPPRSELTQRSVFSTRTEPSEKSTKKLL